MNDRQPKKNTLRQLQSLSDDPNKQAAAAIDLLQPGARHDLLMVATKVLAENPSEDAHDALLSVYRHLALDGPKRDPGAYVRSAALNALRPIAQMSDTPLLLQAVETFEYLPPDFLEEASALRAAALLALNELDDEAAGYYAARFLVDGQTAKMSAEPALTAVRVLASRHMLVTLYQYVMQAGGLLIPEVSSECLRNLTAVPESLIPGLVTVMENRSSPVESLGLFDLLIEHESGPQAVQYIEDYLRHPDDFDVYRYVVLTAMAARREELTRLICEIALDETDEDRRTLLIAALEPYSSAAQVRETLQQITDQSYS